MSVFVLSLGMWPYFQDAFIKSKICEDNFVLYASEAYINTIRSLPFQFLLIFCALSIGLWFVRSVLSLLGASLCSYVILWQ
jgi:ABC-type methionine transport system permease subunit